MRVTLSTFTRTQTESELGPDLSAAVSTALLYYADKLRSGRPPLPPPRFIAANRQRTGVEAVEVTLAPDVVEALVGEAARHGTDLDALATHSLLVYLAELDFLGASACVV
jgi:hypothetical protein